MATTIEPNNAYPKFNNFKSKIEDCLKLIDKDAINFRKWMDGYNLKIRAFKNSGANFGNGSIDIGLATFNASKTWLASVLIHETVHFWQYRSGKYQAGKPAELEANLYQMIVLKAIGAPQGEITHLQSQTGGHADLDGDGDYDIDDYRLRNY